MSLSAFAAAIAPKAYGSSTMGGKKSTVWTRGDAVRQPVDGGIVAAAVADQQIGVVLNG